MRKVLINLHSNTDNKPIGQLELGEIGIRHNNIDDTRIFVEIESGNNRNDNTLVEFVPKKYVDDRLNLMVKVLLNPNIQKYVCMDMAAEPVKVTDGYVFDSGVTQITPCEYDWSNVTTLSKSSGIQLPSGLTSIMANMENVTNSGDVNVDIPNPNLDGISIFASFTAESILSEIDLYTPNLTKGKVMFYGCINLKNVNLNTNRLTDGTGMFCLCTSLSSFTSDLSNLTNGRYMFMGCTALSSFTIDLPSLTDGNYMFNSCTSLSLFTSDLSSLTNGDSMFYGCKSLSSFASDLSSLTNGYGMFGGCTSLTNVTLSGVLDCPLDFSACPLSVDSIVNIISVLVDLTGQSSKTLTIGSTNLAKLSDEQIAVATNKNWILA